MKHFEADGVAREKVWRRGEKAWNVLEESQRVQFDGHLGIPKRPLGTKLKTVTGPDSGAPRAPCDSGYGCLTYFLHLRVQLCTMGRLYYPTRLASCDEK